MEAITTPEANDQAGERPDLDAMFQMASRGDADAQAALALNARQHGLDGLVQLSEALAVAELYARMAASQGKPEHIMTLATILGTRYDYFGTGPLDPDTPPPLVEVMLCVKIAADAGHEPAVRIAKSFTDTTAALSIAETIWTELEHSASEVDQCEDAAEANGAD